MAPPLLPRLDARAAITRIPPRDGAWGLLLDLGAPPAPLRCAPTSAVRGAHQTLLGRKPWAGRHPGATVEAALASQFSARYFPPRRRALGAGMVDQEPPAQAEPPELFAPFA